jgi:hypothetical protein
MLSATRISPVQRANGLVARLHDSTSSLFPSVQSLTDRKLTLGPPNRFWLRLPKTATKTFKRRFLETWIDYVESVAQQAEHRSESRILDLDSYFPLRRHTSGAPSTIWTWTSQTTSGSTQFSACWRPLP